MYKYLYSLLISTSYLLAMENNLSLPNNQISLPSNFSTELAQETKIKALSSSREEFLRWAVQKGLSQQHANRYYSYYFNREVMPNVIETLNKADLYLKQYQELKQELDLKVNQAPRNSIEQRGKDTQYLEGLGENSNTLLKEIINKPEEMSHWLQDMAWACANVYKVSQTTKPGTQQANSEQDLLIPIYQTALKILKSIETKLSNSISTKQNFTNDLKQYKEINPEGARTLETILGAKIDIADKVTGIKAQQEDISKKIRETYLLGGVNHKAYIDKMNDMLAIGSPYMQKYQTIDVLYRSGQELSGAILYNKEDNEILLTFAGSKSTWDWIRNFQAWGSQGDTRTRFGVGLNIHKGVFTLFNEGLNKFIPRLNSYLNKLETNHNRDKPIKFIVTGHSLGGALSLVASHYIKEEVIPHRNWLQNATVQNISFGAPRALDPASVEKVEAILGKGNVIRIWNEQDRVPAIVLGTLTNSKHAGIDFMLRDSFFHEIYKPFIAQHSMSRYHHIVRDRIKDLVNFIKEKSQENRDIRTLEDDLTAQEYGYNHSVEILKEFSRRGAIKEFNTLINDYIQQWNRLPENTHEEIRKKIVKAEIIEENLAIKQKLSSSTLRAPSGVSEEPFTVIFNEGDLIKNFEKKLEALNNPAFQSPEQRDLNQSSFIMIDHNNKTHLNDISSFLMIEPEKQPNVNQSMFLQSRLFQSHIKGPKKTKNQTLDDLKVSYEDFSSRYNIDINPISKCFGFMTHIINDMDTYLPGLSKQDKGDILLGMLDQGYVFGFNENKRINPIDRRFVEDLANKEIQKNQRFAKEYLGPLQEFFDGTNFEERLNEGYFIRRHDGTLEKIDQPSQKIITHRKILYKILKGEERESSESSLD